MCIYLWGEPLHSLLLEDYPPRTLVGVPRAQITRQLRGGRLWESSGPEPGLTNAGVAVGMQGVLLVAATEGPRVCVLAAVLAASIAIVTGDWAPHDHPAEKQKPTRPLLAGLWAAPCGPSAPKLATGPKVPPALLGTGCLGVVLLHPTLG